MNEEIKEKVLEEIKAEYPKINIIQKMKFKPYENLIIEKTIQLKDKQIKELEKEIEKKDNHIKLLGQKLKEQPKKIFDDIEKVELFKAMIEQSGGFYIAEHEWLELKRKWIKPNDIKGM